MDGDGERREMGDGESNTLTSSITADDHEKRQEEEVKC